jgi:hypothetical protein
MLSCSLRNYLGEVRGRETVLHEDKSSMNLHPYTVILSTRTPPLIPSPFRQRKATCRIHVIVPQLISPQALNVCTKGKRCLVDGLGGFTFRVSSSHFVALALFSQFPRRCTDGGDGEVI